MELISKIIAVLGGDEAHSVTVCPGRLAYFRGVKGVLEFSSQKIVLSSGKIVLSCEGEGLCVGKYFQGDLVITGNVLRVCVQ